MDALHYFRPHSGPETDDLAADFIENEVGRLDWSVNWPRYKAKHPDYPARIQNFFHRLGREVDAEAIARHLDLMVITRPGPWK